MEMEMDAVQSILQEHEIYLRSLKNLTSNSAEKQMHINSFVRIKWSPPVLNLLDQYPIPHVALKVSRKKEINSERNSTPPVSSPYRQDIRPIQEKVEIPSPHKRAKRKIKDMLLEMEILEEENRKAKQVVQVIDPNKYHLQQKQLKKKKKGLLANELIGLIVSQNNPEKTVALSMSEVDYSKWRDEVMNLEVSLKSDLQKHIKLPELDLNSTETFKISDFKTEIDANNNEDPVVPSKRTLSQMNNNSAEITSPMSKKAKFISRRNGMFISQHIDSIPVSPMKLSSSSPGISHPELYNTINQFWEKHPEHRLEMVNAGTNILLDSLNIKPTPIQMSDEMNQATEVFLEGTGTGFWNDEIGSTIARPLSASLYCSRKLQELRPETAAKYPLPEETLYNNQAKSPKVLKQQGLKRSRSNSPEKSSRTKENNEIQRVKLFRYSPEAHQAAYKIQKLARQRGNLKFLCCRKIQSSWRGFLDRRRYRQMIFERNAAANDIQRIIRGHFGRLRAKNWHEISRHLAAAKIQALYRSRKTRAWVKVYKRERYTMMSERIQRYYRCYAARKKLRFLKGQRDNKCAIKIQKTYRGHRARTAYRKYKNEALHSIKMIQRNWRGKMGRLMSKLARQKRRNDKATLIQKRYRKHLDAVAKKRERMCRLIQRFYRGYKGRVKAKKLRAYLVAQETKRRMAEEKFINTQVERANSRIRAFIESAQGKGVVKIEKKIAYERRKKLNAILVTLSPEHQKEIQIREAFHMFDEDGSGSIDREEFNNVTKELATPMTKEELTLAIKNIDLDGSGDIDYFEFKHWFILQSKQAQSGARMAIMVAALKGRKIILDMMGTTDERMAKKVLIVREVEKERANAMKTFREKHPARFICPKCKVPFTFVNEIDIHFKKKDCRVVLEEENADPIMDEFFKVHVKTEEDEKKEKELQEKAENDKKNRSQSSSITNLFSGKTAKTAPIASTPTTPPSPPSQTKEVKATSNPSSMMSGILDRFKWNKK